MEGTVELSGSQLARLLSRAGERRLSQHSQRRYGPPPLPRRRDRPNRREQRLSRLPARRVMDLRDVGEPAWRRAIGAPIDERSKGGQHRAAARPRVQPRRTHSSLLRLFVSELADGSPRTHESTPTRQARALRRRAPSDLARLCCCLLLVPVVLLL